MNEPVPLVLAAGQKMLVTYPHALGTWTMRPQSPYLGVCKWLYQAVETYGKPSLLPLWLEGMKTPPIKATFYQHLGDKPQKQLAAEGD